MNTLTADNSTLIINTNESGWEDLVVDLVDKYGQVRRSPLDSSGYFMIMTEKPVIIDNVFILMGVWPAPIQEMPEELLVPPAVESEAVTGATND